MNKYGIPPEHWDRIVSTIRNHEKVTGIILFGSRAKGSYKNGSDIDFAITGEQILTKDIVSIHTALDNLDLPWAIDLVIFDSITDIALTEHIERCGVRIY